MEIRSVFLFCSTEKEKEKYETAPQVNSMATIPLAWYLVIPTYAAGRGAGSRGQPTKTTANTTTNMISDEITPTKKKKTNETTKSTGKGKKKI